MLTLYPKTNDSLGRVAGYRGTLIPLKYLPLDELRNFTWKTVVGSTRPIVPSLEGKGDFEAVDAVDLFAGGRNSAAGVQVISAAISSIARRPRMAMHSSLKARIFNFTNYFQTRCN